jgi:hypothetical protein
VADERASIAIAVTDEASAKIKEISDAFEDMRRKMQQGTQQASQNFQRFREESDKHREGIREQIGYYQTLGVSIRSTFVEGTRALNTMGLFVTTSGTFIARPI